MAGASVKRASGRGGAHPSTALSVEAAREASLASTHGAQELAAQAPLRPAAAEGVAAQAPPPSEQMASKAHAGRPRPLNASFLWMEP